VHGIPQFKEQNKEKETFQKQSAMLEEVVKLPLALVWHPPQPYISRTGVQLGLCSPPEDDSKATLEPQPVQRPENSSPGFQPGVRGHFFGEFFWMGWLGEGMGLPPATSHQPHCPAGAMGQLTFPAPPSNWGDFRA
jgi:hypothetical protein